MYRDVCGSVQERPMSHLTKLKWLDQCYYLSNILIVVKRQMHKCLQRSVWWRITRITHPIPLKHATGRFFSKNNNSTTFQIRYYIRELRGFDSAGFSVRKLQKCKNTAPHGRPSIIRKPVRVHRAFFRQRRRWDTDECSIWCTSVTAVTIWRTKF